MKDEAPIAAVMIHEVLADPYLVRPAQSCANFELFNVENRLYTIEILRQRARVFWSPQRASAPASLVQPLARCDAARPNRPRAPIHSAAWTSPTTCRP